MSLESDGGSLSKIQESSRFQKNIFLLVILAPLICVFIVSLKYTSMDHFINFGLSVEGVASGKVWQFFTYAFLHGGWAHFSVNFLLIWLFAKRLMMQVSSKKVFNVFLAGIVIGGALHLVNSFVRINLGYEDQYLVGVSGACYALLLAVCKLSPYTRVFRLPVSGRNLGSGVVLTEVLLALIDPSMGVPVFSNLGHWLVSIGAGPLFQISRFCHIGGALAGWLLAIRYHKQFTSAVYSNRHN